MLSDTQDKQSTGHSSSKDSGVIYLALYGGTIPTTWTEILTQEYCDEVASKLQVRTCYYFK
ncbi:MAG: hypothetical protein CMC18_03975 [Flavobacteriaceae bacterium]|nr:hypothetical protein [Flavobacteriaceae bacterium]